MKIKLKNIRNPDCTDCKLHQAAEKVCELGTGSKTATVMVVAKMPNSKYYRNQLADELERVGLDMGDVYFTAALKCKDYESNVGVRDMKACSKYLDAELAAVKPKWVLVLGNEALRVTTGHSGIMKYRGQIIDKGSYKVVPTLSPASIVRNPGQRSAWVADLAYFAAQVSGKKVEKHQGQIHVIDNLDKLKKLAKWLKKAELISYDIETNATPTEFYPDARIVSLSGTILVNGKEILWALPLYHPESPFRSNWRKVLKLLAPYLERVPKQIAHNGKYDARWLRHFGVNMRVTFDTMLAAHLLDENRQKGLKPLGRTLLGVPPWGIDTSNLLADPLDEVLEYNALDTYYTYKIYLIFREQLVEAPRQLRIFKFITMPAVEAFITAERYGVWVDREKLATATKIAFDTRDHLNEQLMEWVPDPEDPSVGWPTNAKGKPVEVNFNASNFARWWLFTYLKMPILARGKVKDDGRPGDPSMAEAVMLELKKLRHPAIELLLERAKWQKYCSTYLTQYAELADENDRIHTTFKLGGTVTGRISSGKEDAEKISARPSTIRGVNLQQVPRDEFIRGLFGAPPGWDFIEADYSQVELRVVAFLSRDRTMMGIYQRGEDIHLATAAWVLGIPPSQVSKDDRKKAKAVNFGFVYGMGWRKFIATAFEKYGAVFSEVEAQQVRREFFNRFSGLLPWHARQRRLVRTNSRVQSPIGRIRHLPDINSEEQGVQAEAERQAINSPVQSFASDMNLLAMVLVEQRFREEGIRGHVLGTVHDATNFEVHRKDTARALPIIKDTMENLPLERLFGVHLDVPMIADLKVGSHWGGAQELTEDQVYNWKGSKK